MRSFTRADQTWYATANGFTRPEFWFSGRTPGEFAACWRPSAEALRLEVFTDGCALLVYEYLDLALWMDAHPDATADELQEWCSHAGIEDVTQRERPEP